jgi:hypothetical protein
LKVVVGIRVPKKDVEFLDNHNIQKPTIWEYGMKAYIQSHRDLSQDEITKLKERKDKIEEALGKVRSEIERLEMAQNGIRQRVRDLLPDFKAHVVELFLHRPGRANWVRDPWVYIRHMAERQPDEGIPWFQDHDIIITWSDLVEITEGMD